MQWLGARGIGSYQARMGDPSILICIPTLGSGGAERQVRLLAPRLVARGVRVALASRMDEADIETLTSSGVRCFPIEVAGNYDPRLLSALRRAARACGADIVHTFLPQMDILGGLVALLSGRIWLLTERSSALAYSPIAKDRFRAWLGWRARAVVANSESGLALWPGHRDGRVIANGLDHDAIAAAPPLSPAEEALVAGRQVVLSVARLAPQKRPDIMLAAIARLKARVPDALVLMFGEGPDEPALKAQAAALGIEDHVRFMGYSENIWSWLRRADLFASSSAYEGHPNAVLEAAAVGLPMVLTDIAMHRDTVGRDGALFVPLEDADALGEGIATLLGDGEMRARVAACALRRVEPLSIDRAADHYAELYRRLAASAS